MYGETWLVLVCSQYETAPCRLSRLTFFRRGVLASKTGKIMIRNVALRFWDKVEKCNHGDLCIDCCWLWGGVLVSDGYGQLYIGRIGDKRIRKPAHVVSWRLHNNMQCVPIAMKICHDCDNPPCVNPHHLWLGTNKQNMEDMTSKGRQFQPKGSLHGEAKLTEWKVQRILQLFITGHWSYKMLAERFGVTNTKIGQIIKGKAWLHVERPEQHLIDDAKRLWVKQKLTEADVKEICRLYPTGQYTQEQLGVMFGISERQISTIVRGMQHQNIVRPLSVNNLRVGSTNGNSRLTEHEVRRIRNLSYLGWSSRKLAAKFHVSQRSILMIVNYETWKDLK